MKATATLLFVFFATQTFADSQGNTVLQFSAERNLVRSQMPPRLVARDQMGDLFYLNFEKRQFQPMPAWFLDSSEMRRRNGEWETTNGSTRIDFRTGNVFMHFGRGWELSSLQLDVARYAFDHVELDRNFFSYALYAHGPSLRFLMYERGGKPFEFTWPSVDDHGNKIGDFRTFLGSPFESGVVGLDEQGKLWLFRPMGPDVHGHLRLSVRQMSSWSGLSNFRISVGQISGLVRGYTRARGATLFTIGTLPPRPRKPLDGTEPDDLFRPSVWVSELFLGEMDSSPLYSQASGEWLFHPNKKEFVELYSTAQPGLREQLMKPRQPFEFAPLDCDLMLMKVANDN